MDEINEKAIKDIIDYYDKKKEEPEDKQEEDAPALVELIAEAQKEKDTSSVRISDTPKIIQINDYDKKSQKPDEQTSKEDENSEQATEEAEQNIGQVSEEESSQPTGEETEAENTEQSDFQEQEEAPEQSDFQEQEKAAEQKDDTAKDSDNQQEKQEREAALASLEDFDLIEYDDEDDDYHFSKKQIAAFSIVTLIIMALVIIFVNVDTGIIGSYKHNFSKNAAAILEKMGIDLSSDDTKTKEGAVKETEHYSASTKDTVTVPFEKAGTSVFSKYRGGIICSYTNYLGLIDNTGNTVWENTTTIVQPILKTAGNYILLAEKGGKKICLYNDSRLVYAVDTEDNILSCNLSSNGDVVAITDKSAYKGSVVVYNKEGNQIFAWSSGSDNIISADISASSRRVAVSLLNTDTQVKTTVQFFDIKKTESYAQVIFEDTILFDINFIGDTVNAFGDNCIAGMTSNGAVLYDKRFDNAEFVHYSADDSGNKILAFDASNIPLINIYNSSDTLKQQLSSDEIPDFVDIFGNYIVFNNGRDIIYGKAGSKQMAKFTASMDIKALMMLDKNIVAAVYSNSIEIVRM